MHFRYQLLFFLFFSFYSISLLALKPQADPLTFVCGSSYASADETGVLIDHIWQALAQRNMPVIFCSELYPLFRKSCFEQAHSGKAPNSVLATLLKNKAEKPLEDEERYQALKWACAKETCREDWTVILLPHLIVCIPGHLIFRYKWIIDTAKQYAKEWPILPDYQARLFFSGKLPLPYIEEKGFWGEMTDVIRRESPVKDLIKLLCHKNQTTPYHLICMGHGLPSQKRGSLAGMSIYEARDLIEAVHLSGRCGGFSFFSCYALSHLGWMEGVIKELCAKKKAAYAITFFVKDVFQTPETSTTLLSGHILSPEGVFWILSLSKMIEKKSFLYQTSQIPDHGVQFAGCLVDNSISSSFAFSCEC